MSEEPEPDFDVIVVGAGIAGCVCAYQLARQGRSVLLIERGEAPGSKKVHIPVATIGIIGYGLIVLTSLADWTWVTLQLAEIGFFCALMLSYLEAFVIQKWCIYCVWSQTFITAIVICAIVAAILKHRRRRFEHSAVVTA